jgi:hypothetical protein
MLVGDSTVTLAALVKPIWIATGILSIMPDSNMSAVILGFLYAISQTICL